MRYINKWEKEYQDPALVTLHNEPQATVRRFLRMLKKSGIDIAEQRVLDLGCGTGRNANEIAGRGAQVSGIDIAPTAIAHAHERAAAENVSVDYRVGDIGKTLPYDDAAFTIALDVTSSNALNEAQRAMYLTEVARVLEPGAWFFVRALCKDADKNAKRLIKDYPGVEQDTYIMPDTGFTERVFTRADFESTYAPFFTMIDLKKETGYTRFNNQSYKRQFWVAVMQKLDK